MKIIYRNKRLVAIIPARSGSKGILDKNIKYINEKPLLSYTIEACKKADLFDEIIVSTDSVKYARIALEYGADVPFLRPKELATDTASSRDVIFDVLHKFSLIGKEFDYFMLLQPTSPLRNETNIKKSVEILFEHKADSVVSICKVEHPTSYNVSLHEDGKIIQKSRYKQMNRRQDDVTEYRINGAIYLAEIKFFLKNKTFYGKNTYAYVMQEEESVDIDNELQFNYAQWLLQARQS